MGNKRKYSCKQEFRERTEKNDWILGEGYNRMKPKDTIRRTIPNIIDSYNEAVNPDQIERLENLIFSMYINVLLVLLAAAKD